MTLTELVGVAVCIAALVALHQDTRTPDGMPSRRQRRMWERERLIQPKWNRKTW